ncbi:MAG: calcium-binding protein [Pseudomonadota bacterium]
MTTTPGDSTTTARLRPGETLRAEIDFLGDNDWVRVNVAEDATYVFTLDADGSRIRPFLRLYDAVSVLRDSDLGGPSARLTYTAAATGHIFLSAASLYSSGEIGGYALSASTPLRQSADRVPDDPTTPLLLTPGAAVTTRIDSAADADWIGLSVQVGAQYQILYSPALPAPETVLLTIYNAQGAVIRELELSDARAVRFNAWRDETHFVSVAATGVESLGNLSLSLVQVQSTTRLSSNSDSHSGTDGSDIIHGLGGHDSLSGQDGDDTILGGAGADRIDGGAFDDRLFGGEGQDSLTGGTGRDGLYGGNGVDRLDGGRATDSLFGGIGSDVLMGGIGNDSVVAHEGHDTLFGGPNDDTLFGGRGNDTLDGGRGRDTMTGGLGDDLFIVVNTADDTITDFTQGADQVDFSAVPLLADFDDVVLWAGEVSGSAAIRMGFGSLVLEGIGLDALTPDDFIF